MRFAAPWDRTLRVVTAVTVLGMLAFLGATAWFLLQVGRRSGTPDFAIPAALVLAAVAATIGLAWALAPKGYAILGGTLVVRRPLRPIAIPLASVRAAVADDEALRGAIRVGGSGGLFGYYGRFWSRRLGAFRACATRRTGLVVVDTATERFVLSPEPVPRFLEALLARASAAGQALPGAPLAPRPMPRRSKAWMIALAALAPLAVGGALLGGWAWTPVSARVEGAEIRVERRLAGPALIPLASVRAVEPLRAEQGRRLRRVSGASGPGGVRWGHFRSRELGDVQLWDLRGTGYVLLDTDDGRVVLTPDDPDGFVAEVRAALRGR